MTTYDNHLHQHNKLLLILKIVIVLCTVRLMLMQMKQCSSSSSSIQQSSSYRTLSELRHMKWILSPLYENTKYQLLTQRPVFRDWRRRDYESLK